VEFCRAREVHRQTDQRLRNDRTENLEAKRAIGAILQESLQQQGVQCIEIPGAARGTFVRVSTPTARARVPRNEDEIRALLAGLGVDLGATLAPEIPDRVIQLVRARLGAQAAGREPPKPRLSVVAKPMKRDAVLRLTSAAPEVQRLTEQFVKATHDAKAVQGELRVSRKAKTEAEAVALQKVTTPVPIRVTSGTREVTLQVVRCERKARTKALGMKRFVSACRDAAARAATGPRDTFDERLTADVLAVFRAETVCPASSYLKLLKLPG
jgi:hypothetical protein